MDESAIQYRVGALVLATVLILAILVVFIGGTPTAMHGTYTVFITFPQAPGVIKSTPVRKSGVLVGRVSDVKLLNEGGVRVTVKIDNVFPLFHNEVCRIDSSLLGDSSLQFFLASQTMGPQVKDGESLHGICPDDPLKVINNMQGDMAAAFSSLARTSDNLGKVVARVSLLLERNESRIDKILVQADQSMDVMRRALDNANEVIGDPNVRSELRLAISQLPGLFQESRQTLGRVRESFDLVQKNLTNMEEFTRPLGEHGPAIVGRIEGALQNVDALISSFTEFSRNLNNPKGSLGQLVNDPEMYQRINRTVGRIEELTQELRPILDDARVFTDKIARHPETLGVRGALERRPGIK